MTTPATPHCYRHPDRPTWVSCTRCGRPICPDCMTPAAVGHHCPECVAEGRRTSRVPRTVFGGHTDGEHGSVTKALIGINVGVWLLTILVAVATGEVSGGGIGRLIAYGGITDLVRWGAAVPAEVFTDGSLHGGIADGQLWRLLTAGFFHFGILHIALNMYGLWILGQHCEALLGRWRFLALYLLSGVGGATAEFLFGDPGRYAAGASGSIFGLMAALFFFFKAMDFDVRAITTLLLLNLGLGFFIANVSVLGHIGGLITGGLIGACFAFAPRGPSRTAVQVAGVSAVGLILVGLIVIRIGQYGLL